MVPESLLGRHALLFAGDDEERQHRQHRAVHGHRHRHLIERDAVEQRAHVVDRSRWRRPPCRHRRSRADDPNRSRDGWRDRRRRRRPAGRRRGCAGRRRWNPRPSRSRHIGGSSRAAATIHRRVGAAQIGRHARHPVEKVEAVRDRRRHRPASPRCLPASARARPSAGAALPPLACVETHLGEGRNARHLQLHLVVGGVQDLQAYHSPGEGSC